jgi:hypothetical protein
MDKLLLIELKREKYIINGRIERQYNYKSEKDENSNEEIL